MNQTLRLPACYRYIKGEDTADKLYTLAVKISPRHAEDIAGKDFHSLLMASRIITADHPLPQTIENISCFAVISEYKCGFICHMCPYAARNKNEMETEESLLLSYAIKSYGNLQFLKNAGLGNQNFCPLFLLNEYSEGKIVSTLPLLKLSYHYMERTVNQKTDFSALPAMIAGALDQNNKGRLLPQNVQTVREYLSKLQHNGGSISQDKATEVLNRILHPTQTLPLPPVKTNISDAKVIPKTSENTEKQTCITGLLEQIPNTEKTHVTLTVSDTPRKSEFHTNQIISRAKPKDKKPLSAPSPKLAEESLYLPAAFSPSEAERTGFPFYCIAKSRADLQQFEIFLQFNPVIGAEIVEDAETKKQMLLLCASNQFYYIDTDHSQALSLLRLYFSKSSIRRQVCMEPYKLYYFLQANDINDKNIYSLRTVYKLLAEIRNSQAVKTPSAMVKELTSKTNLYDYSPYIFTMLQYVKMYEVLSSQKLLQSKAAQNRLHMLSHIDSLMGISYELKDVAQTTDPLFLLDEERDPQFLYCPETKMKEGIYSVTFSFSAENPCGSLVSDILCRIARKDLAKIQGYRLLQYRQDSFTIATTAQHYEQLCETVANLATYLAEKQNLIPLIIKEDTIK